MTDTTNFRMERIEKLLHELEYEVTRGMMEADIEEEIGFCFIVPISKAIPKGIVRCEFRTRPMPDYYRTMEDLKPRLRIVSSEDTP